MARIFELVANLSQPTPPRPERRPSGWESAEAALSRYNRYRRLRLEGQVGEKGAEALQLLPLLLHVNQSGLPGYVDVPGCPAGIADYSPTSRDLDLVRRHFPGAQLKRAGILRPAVDLVAAMGSVGTIGFSGESDIDMWVCHSAAVGGAGLGLYRQKVQAVEAWANEHSGLEIHLFLQATARIRADDFGETDVEGCGSAMGALLKEEFYRTGVLLAGKPPFWWLVPAGASPAEYEEHLHRLRADPGVSSDGYADLGSVARVPVGELFGAALWQIVKGWKSPFKSALKMALLEKAVCSEAEVLPLCESLKARVLAGERPDPYRLLFDEVLAYYRRDGDGSAEDLLTRSFYLKTGIRLDPDALDTPPRSREDEASLWEYVQAWGWGPRRIRHLNEFGRWKFEWVQALAKEVDRFFLRTYKRIRAALDRSGETQRITPRDLTILGRKLQAIYRRAPHKVATLHLVTRGVAEPSLSLYQETLPDGEAPWRLYRGRVTVFNVDEKDNELLHQSTDAAELLVWAAQNKLLGAQTRIFCRGLERRISAADLEGLGQMLAAFVEKAEQDEPPLAHLLENPRHVRMLVIPNLGIAGEELLEIGALHVTTWGETFYRSWSGAEAFGAFAEECLIPFLFDGRGHEHLEVFAPPHKVGTLDGPHRRLRRELPALLAHLGGTAHRPGIRRRHVGPVGSNFFVLDRVGERDVRYRAFANREGLLRYLSGVGPYQRVETRVEGHRGELSLLKTLSESSNYGTIDIYFLQEPEQETLFVVDEVGNLIHFPHRPTEEPYALARLLQFLEGIATELTGQPESPLAGRTLAEVVRIHTLVYEGACRSQNTTHESLARVRALNLKPMGLTIERSGGDGDEPGGYRITWGMQTIRSGEVESPLGELRRRILEARGSGLHYEVFVTRLFLDDAFVAEYGGDFVTTGHYLFYKKAIEQRLST